MKQRLTHRASVRHRTQFPPTAGRQHQLDGPRHAGMLHPRLIFLPSPHSSRRAAPCDTPLPDEAFEAGRVGEASFGQTCCLDVAVSCVRVGRGQGALERGDEVEVGVDAAGGGEVGASAVGGGVAHAGAGRARLVQLHAGEGAGVDAAARAGVLEGSDVADGAEGGEGGVFAHVAFWRWGVM